MGDTSEVPLTELIFVFKMEVMDTLCTEYWVVFCFIV